MNKTVLISNLEVLTKELNKVEHELGKEYASILGSTLSKRQITKEEFYMETALTLMQEAITNVEMLTQMLKNRTPNDLVKIAEESGVGYQEASMEMKKMIVSHKLDKNPMLGVIASFEALIRMAQSKED